MSTFTEARVGALSAGVMHTRAVLALAIGLLLDTTGDATVVLENRELAINSLVAFMHEVEDEMHLVEAAESN